MALGCDMIKRLSTPYDCTDKYMWIWIVAGVGGAAAIGLIVYAVMAFIEMGEDEEVAAIEGQTDAQKEKSAASEDTNSVDFSDYHAISKMKSAIPSGFAEHLETGVEYIQKHGLKSVLHVNPAAAALA